MSLDWEGLQKQTYICARCGKEVKGKDLIMLDRIKCPHCGFKVIRKIRPPIVKRFKTV